MSEIATFLKTQQIGQIRIGQTREDLVAIFGRPDKWVGQPPNIGWQVLDPDQAHIWLYYGESVGAEFDGDGVVQAILIYADSVNKDSYPFNEWPDIGAWTINDLIKYADSIGIENKMIKMNESWPRLVVGDCCFVIADPIRSRYGCGYIGSLVGIVVLYNNKFNSAFIKATALGGSDPSSRR